MVMNPRCQLKLLLKYSNEKEGSPNPLSNSDNLPIAYTEN